MPIESQITRFKINIKKLKRRVGRSEGGIATKLNMAAQRFRQNNIRARIKFGKKRGINNKSTSMGNIFIVSGDSAVRKIEGKTFARR